MKKRKEEKAKVQHGVANTSFDNLGGGWRMECLCGHITSAWTTLAGCGEEMDDHFEETK